MERLIAIGDIHGCFNQFRVLVEERINLNHNDKVVLLGDYIDRGDHSKEVIDYILKLISNGFDVVTLIGNHESMLLDAFNNSSQLYSWILNGGSDTLNSFGINALSGFQQVHIDFFKRLQFWYSLGNFLFVHAGFNDEITDPFTDSYQMIWARNDIYTNPVFTGKIIIHGHTPITLALCQKNIADHSHVINIDTGCVYKKMNGYGHLTAIELNSMELYSV